MESYVEACTFGDGFLEEADVGDLATDVEVEEFYGFFEAVGFHEFYAA